MAGGDSRDNSPLLPGAGRYGDVDAVGGHSINSFALDTALDTAPALMESIATTLAYLDCSQEDVNSAVVSIR